MLLLGSDGPPDHPASVESWIVREQHSKDSKMQSTREMDLGAGSRSVTVRRRCGGRRGSRKLTATVSRGLLCERLGGAAVRWANGKAGSIAVCAVDREGGIPGKCMLGTGTGGLRVPQCGEDHRSELPGWQAEGRMGSLSGRGSFMMLGSIEVLLHTGTATQGGWLVSCVEIAPGAGAGNAGEAGCRARHLPCARETNSLQDGRNWFSSLSCDGSTHQSLQQS